jgi:hypothetical protein
MTNVLGCQPKLAQCARLAQSADKLSRQQVSYVVPVFYTKLVSFSVIVITLKFTSCSVVLNSCTRRWLIPLSAIAFLSGSIIY